MKRFSIVLLCISALLILSACGGSAPEVSRPVETSVPEAEAVPPQEEAPAPETAAAVSPAVLSPGAAESSTLSAAFQTDDTGTVYTGAAVGEGFTALNDLLPEGTGYVSRFLLADGYIYAAVKDAYFSLEPSSLLRFSLGENAGEGELLTDDLAADGRFVLAGDALFFRSYADGGLIRLDLTDGTLEPGIPDCAGLLAAADGFMYYAKADGVYRNDSTLAAEAKLFDAIPGELAAVSGRLYCLRSSGEAAALECRSVDDGSLLFSADLDGPADNFLVSGERVYVPQPENGAVRIFDRLTGEKTGDLPLSLCGSYCVLHCAAEDALYYETFLDELFPLCRVSLSGGDAEIVGEIIMF